MIKSLRNSLLLLLLLPAFFAAAQNVPDLLREASDLQKSKNYAAAIEKYKAALAVDPANVTAKYQLAFALNTAGRGAEALPYLQDVVNAAPTAPVLLSSYTLMAGIYDRIGQAAKAISAYKTAIELDSASYDLNYGLGLTYFRNKQYVEAEQRAVNALRLNARQPASLRLYGLVTFHQNERAPALLSLCNFLYLDPKGSRADEAYSNIQSIIQGGVLKTEPGQKAPQPGAEALALNQAITSAVAGVESKKPYKYAEKFSDQLKAVFTAVGALAQKQSGNRYFRTQFALTYYKLSQSPHMQAFAFYISQANDKRAAAWVAANAQQVESMEKWMAAN
ncbi:tetratricopeptide repeat protein [Mucilaginibacter aquatilis]|uniref:Tetratricopeptide repeat protein n=1 Tax=Mucilaginibacter aquatilis TaxID=1517760 RepID=A0A6I4I5J1_9SPHI|nr:tetratricopeptide repeat protein [Mucilaginibacter aquatilis]MVN90465.1 tetratricopeptide repeat protein [Mucilaginibacter aquatilis]